MCREQQRRSLDSWWKKGNNKYRLYVMGDRNLGRTNAFLYVGFWCVVCTLKMHVSKDERETMTAGLLWGKR